MAFFDKLDSTGITSQYTYDTCTASAIAAKHQQTLERMAKARLKIEFEKEYLYGMSLEEVSELIKTYHPELLI